jgi:hypothetical protein
MTVRRLVRLRLRWGMATLDRFERKKVGREGESAPEGREWLLGVLENSLHVAQVLEQEIGQRQGRARLERACRVVMEGLGRQARGAFRHWAEGCQPGRSVARLVRLGMQIARARQLNVATSPGTARGQAAAVITPRCTHCRCPRGSGAARPSPGRRSARRAPGSRAGSCCGSC